MRRPETRTPAAAEMRSLASGFARRSGIPRWVLRVVVRGSRAWLTVALAAAAPLLLLAVALAGPAAFAAAITSPANVGATFARFVSAVATASAIAVSVATLTLRREMHGVAASLERHKENREFRERPRGREEELPLLLGDFMSETARAVAEAARDAMRIAERTGCDPKPRGVPLTQFLRALEARMSERARSLRAVAADPDEMLLDLLEQDREMPPLLVRRYRREAGLPRELDEALGRLDDLLMTYDVGTGYVKTLDTEWGLSRMSRTILLGTIPAIAASAAMTLAYGEGAIAALGVGGAAALVCGVLAVALFPIAAFVAYLLRFVIVNQHTLPTTGFLLGPENEVLTDARRVDDEVNPPTSP